MFLQYCNQRTFVSLTSEPQTIRVPKGVVATEYTLCAVAPKSDSKVTLYAERYKLICTGVILREIAAEKIGLKAARQYVKSPLCQVTSNIFLI
jgi:hypothetical protein